MKKNSVKIFCLQSIEGKLKSYLLISLLFYAGLKNISLAPWRADLLLEETKQSPEETHDYSQVAAWLC